ncbi:hypothetical protein TrLO_g13844 [Triparma laevis f. longispina]|uniref:Uncharacterized protein n=1 Tax=Triparma laevis f. longispina TaxID=1714387 RepID=A0A9W7EBX2_9STRA|nr:hypothetical protein TrLO_g13844 [Triparma laevis f. longispina]
MILLGCLVIGSSFLQGGSVAATTSTTANNSGFTRSRIVRKRRFPIPFVPRKLFYPHPVSGELVVLDEYIEALEEKLAESESRISSLSSKLMHFRSKFTIFTKNHNTAAQTKAAQYLDKISKCERMIEELNSRLKLNEKDKERGTKETEDLRMMISKNEDLVKEIKAKVMEVYKEELQQVRDSMAGLVDKKVEEERKKFQKDLETLRKQKDLEISTLLSEKDAVITKERSKVVKVLTALQEAEVKKQEVESIRRKAGRKREVKGRSGSVKKVKVNNRYSLI